MKMYLSSAAILLHLFSVFTNGMPDRRKQIWYPKKKTASPEGSPPDVASLPSPNSLSPQSADNPAQQTEAQTEPALPETLEMRDLFDEYKPFASSSKLYESRDPGTRTQTSQEIPTYQMFQSPLPFKRDPSGTVTRPNQQQPFGFPYESTDQPSLGQLAQRYHNQPTLINPLRKTVSDTSALRDATARSYQSVRKESEISRPNRKNFREYYAQKYQELHELRDQYEKLFAPSLPPRTNELVNQASPWTVNDTDEAKLHQRYSPTRSELDWGGPGTLPFKQPAPNRDSFSTLILQAPKPSRSEQNQELVGQPHYFGIEQPLMTNQQSLQPWAMAVNNIPAPIATQSRNVDQSGLSLTSQPYWQNVGGHISQPQTDIHQLYSEPVNSPGGKTGTPFDPFGYNSQETQQELPSHSEAQHSLFTYPLFSAEGTGNSTVLTSGGGKQPGEGETDLIFPWDEVAPLTETNTSRTGTDKVSDYFLPATPRTDIPEADPGTYRHIPILQHDTQGSNIYHTWGEPGQPPLSKAFPSEFNRISSSIGTASADLSTPIERPSFTPLEPTDSIGGRTGPQFFPTWLQGQKSGGEGSNMEPAGDEVARLSSSKLSSPPRFSPPGSVKGSTSPPYRPSPLGSPNRYKSALQMPSTQPTISIGESESLRSGHTLQQHQQFGGVRSNTRSAGDELVQSPSSKLSSSPPKLEKVISSPPNRSSPLGSPDRYRSSQPFSTQSTISIGGASENLQSDQTPQLRQQFEGVQSDIHGTGDELAQFPSSKLSSLSRFSPPAFGKRASSPPNRPSPLGSPNRNKSVLQLPSAQPPSLPTGESERLQHQQLEGTGSNFYLTKDGRELSPVSKLSFPPGFGPPGSLKRVFPANRPSPLGSPDESRSVTPPSPIQPMESIGGKEDSQSALILQQDKQREEISSNIKLARDALALSQSLKQSFPPGFGRGASPRDRSSPLGSPVKNTSSPQPLSTQPTESMRERESSQSAVEMQQDQQSEGSEPAQPPVSKRHSPSKLDQVFAPSSSLWPSPFTTSDPTRPILSLPSTKPAESILQLPSTKPAETITRATEAVKGNSRPILTSKASQLAKEGTSTHRAGSELYQPPKSKEFSPPEFQNVTSSSSGSLLLKSADPYRPPMHSPFKESRLAKLQEKENSSFGAEGPVWSTISSTEFSQSVPTLQRRRQLTEDELSISIERNERTQQTRTRGIEESRVSDAASKVNKMSKYIIPAYKSKVSNLGDKDPKSFSASAPPSVSSLQNEEQPRKDVERNSPPKSPAEQFTSVKMEHEIQHIQLFPEELPDRALPVREPSLNPKEQLQRTEVEAPAYSLFSTSQRRAPGIPQSISTSQGRQQALNVNLPSTDPAQQTIMRFGSISDPVVPRKVLDGATHLRPDFSLFASAFLNAPQYHQVPPTNESQDPEYTLFPTRERIPPAAGKEILKSTSTLQPRKREEETSDKTARKVLHESPMMQPAATPHAGRETIRSGIDITNLQPTQHAIQFGNLSFNEATKTIHRAGKFVPSPSTSSSSTPSAGTYSKITALGEREHGGISRTVSASKKLISPETSSREGIFYPHEQFKPPLSQASDSGKVPAQNAAVVSREGKGQPPPKSTPLSFKQILCQGSYAEGSSGGGEDLASSAKTGGRSWPTPNPASPDASPPFTSFFSSWPISTAGQPLSVLSFSEIVRRNAEKKLQDLRPARGREKRGKKKVTRKDMTGQQDRKKEGARASRILPDEYPRENCVLIVPRKHDADLDIVEEIQRLNVPFVMEREAVPFPTGSLLILCNSLEEAAYLKRVVAKSRTLKNAKEQKIHPRLARIEELGQDVAKKTIIQRGIESAYGEAPRNLRLHHHDHNVKSYATMEVSANLLKRMESNPIIELKGRKFRVDTSIRVDRCEKCKLLGHNWQCGNPERETPKETDACIDCVYFNEQFEEVDKVRKRSVQHRTGDPNCPTRLYYERKWKRCQLPYDEIKEENDFDAFDAEPVDD